MFRKSLRAVAMIGALAITLSVLTAGTANAHSTRIYHGSDYATNDHSHVNAYDRECDGHGVYAVFDDARGTGWIVRDRNGCTGPGTHGDGLRIYRYRLCEISVGCTRWYAS